LVNLLRRSNVLFSMQMAWFDLGAIYVRFMVDKVQLYNTSLPVHFSFPYQHYPTNASYSYPLQNHFYLKDRWEDHRTFRTNQMLFRTTPRNIAKVLISVSLRIRILNAVLSGPMWWRIAFLLCSSDMFGKMLVRNLL
jgi:hypothetical protein